MKVRPPTEPVAGQPRARQLRTHWIDTAVRATFATMALAAIIGNTIQGH